MQGKGAATLNLTVQQFMGHCLGVSGQREGSLADSQQRQGDDLFIVDNSDSDWKVRDYLREWSEISRAFDIATGYFEIGALLALDGKWQQLEKLRILMGDEVSKRTNKALLAGIESVGKILDASLEKEKDKNDFLNGVPAIVEAIRDRKIECRVYAKEKFNGKRECRSFRGKSRSQ